MNDPDAPSANLDLIERIAAAIRDALGEEVDAYPGASTPEQADPFNRAFRAVVRSLIDHRRHLRFLPTGPGFSNPPPPGRAPAGAEGWDQDQIRLLITQEPGSPDDWLAFLVLSSRVQLEPLLDPEES